MSQFEAKDLSYAVEGSALVRNASFALERGTLTMLIGPNGAGKTSLLRLTLGLLEPDSGAALIDGEDSFAMAPDQRARHAAYLPQLRPLIWPQPVRDVVALGRFGYGAGAGRLSPVDEAAVNRAITLCDLEDLADRAADTLSGGELARVHLARALSSQTPLLIADEPVAALDPLYQHEVLRIFKTAAEEGRAILTVIHDLALAARYADRLIWMKEGCIVADGTPQDTMTSNALREVFGVEADVRVDDKGKVQLHILGPV